MKLKQLKLENFRCYGDKVTIDIDELTVLVGRNDAGKSSLLDALEIFFNERAAPEREDLSVYTEDSLVRITCVFSDLPHRLVIDAQHETDLASEYLVNDEGFLEITKVYDCKAAKPKISSVYAHTLHPTAEGYSDLLLLSITALKQRAKSIGVDLGKVNESVSAEIRSAIRSISDDLQVAEVNVELKGEAEKIWAQVKRYLPVYALFKSDRTSTDQDSEAQDPMKAAIKEAIQAQQDALQEITERVKAEVQETANRTVEKIKEMSPDLASQLTPTVSTKNWDTLFSVALAGDEDIPINKRGSGTRRLVLLNFFRAKVEKEAQDGDQGLIYAIEEPETSQHPYNQIMLVKALEELVDTSGCQVLVSTHTPTLARKFDQSSLRLVARNGPVPIIKHGNDEDTIRNIAQSLGVLPDHNVKAFLGVEGPNDIKFLRSISKILQIAGEAIPDLGEEEDAGRLVFVPLGGSNMELWTSRLQEFNRPEFYLMDRDNPPPECPRYSAFAQEISARSNCTSWTTARKELENYIHHDLIATSYPDYAGQGDPFEDVPYLFARVVHEFSESTEDWESVAANPEKLKRKVSSAKRRLNEDFVSQMTPCLLSLVDTEEEVRGWLAEIGQALE